MRERRARRDPVSVNYDSYKHTLFYQSKQVYVEHIFIHAHEYFTECPQKRKKSIKVGRMKSFDIWRLRLYHKVVRIWHLRLSQFILSQKKRWHNIGVPCLAFKNYGYNNFSSVESHPCANGPTQEFGSFPFWQYSN